MNPKKTIKRLGLALLVFFSILLTVFVMNQFVSFYHLLRAIHPTLAKLILGILLLFLTYFILRLILSLLSRPKVLTLRENPTEYEYRQYLLAMTTILAKNHHVHPEIKALKEQDQLQFITASFQELDRLSIPIIKENANSVFLTTAISQNGSLDSLFVLFASLRMVWQLAKIYETRPTWSSLGKLYVQALGVVFAARTIEDTDLIEDQMEPIIAALLGESLTSAVPGLAPLANLVTSSIMEGALNAFFILRIGSIAQSYLGMETPETKVQIRKRASRLAIANLGGIIADNGKLVVKAVTRAVRKAGSRTARKWLGFGQTDTVE